MIFVIKHHQLFCRNPYQYLPKKNFVISAIEKPKKSSFKRIRKNGEFFLNEAPKLLYAVVVNNYRQQKKEAENIPEQDFEIGLPPQPKEYLKFPDYDWF